MLNILTFPPQKYIQIVQIHSTHFTVKDVLQQDTHNKIYQSV